MKKAVICFLIIIMMATFISATAEQYTFSLRNGITWGMSKDDVIAAFRSEPDSDKYLFDDYTEKTFFTVPKNHLDEVWVYYIYGTNLGGPENENLIVVPMGTKKEGLFDIVYLIYYPVEEESNKPYDRLNELKAQLEKKYNISFVNVLDKWETRANIIPDDNVVYIYGYLPDKTRISLLIRKGDNIYSVAIEYKPENGDALYASIKDGSYFTEIPFGL